MMNIQWNKVTWYSKLLAAIFFIFALPVITFYVGREYEETKKQLEEYEVLEAQIGQDTISPLTDKEGAASVTSAIPTSGLYAKAMQEGKTYVGYIAIEDSLGRIITTTKTRNDGHFFLLLPPGSYTVSIIPTKTNSKPILTPISIQKNSINKTTINL